jgi:hypothetical protein
VVCQIAGSNIATDANATGVVNVRHRGSFFDRHRVFLFPRRLGVFYYLRGEITMGPAILVLVILALIGSITFLGCLV